MKLFYGRAHLGWALLTSLSAISMALWIGQLPRELQDHGALSAAVVAGIALMATWWCLRIMGAFLRDIFPRVPVSSQTFWRLHYYGRWQLGSQTAVLLGLLLAPAELPSGLALAFYGVSCGTVGWILCHSWGAFRQAWKEAQLRNAFAQHQDELNK